ncbi:MAG: GNAT family N-acetyltransferase [Chloroflexi bacterium]|nr:GNAT family N-acetyltransferase [Chloroflexota bacterium]
MMNMTIAVQDTSNLLGLEGLTLRNYRSPSDWEAMARVLCASRVADGLEESRHASQLQDLYGTMKNFVLERDLFLVEYNQQLIGYGGSRWWQETDGNFVHAIWWFVLPEWRDRGIPEFLLERLSGHARTMAQAHAPDAQVWFQSFASDKTIWIGELLRVRGFAPVRYFYEMVCAQLGQLPDAPLSPGIQVRPAQPEQYRQVWQANVEAFAEHWGEQIYDEADYARFLKRPDIQPAHWQIAWDGAEVVGMVLNYVDDEENAKYRRKRGHTEEICVRKAWRGRGIAKALLVRSMEMFRDMGFDSTTLGVDIDNPTGALRLYQSVGYETTETTVVYRKRM